MPCWAIRGKEISDLSALIGIHGGWEKMVCSRG
jgi:hypothetical protein